MTAKPAPSGDEREALIEVVRKTRMVPYPDGTGGWLFKEATDGQIADAILAADFRRTVSPAPSGAEAALALRDAADALGHIYQADSAGVTAARNWLYARAEALAPSAGPDEAGAS